MPTMPTNYTLTNMATDVLNAIRNEATTDYKNYVPYATADADSIRKIGAILMDSPDLRNQFLSALINRIGKVLVTSKMYDNPWAVFKKGLLEYGEVVENIFIELAKPFQYNPADAATNVFAREIPDVKVAFAVMNYQKYYKDTIDDKQLSLALMSWDGVTDFINRIIQSMYTAANYDEFLVMKYMMAHAILNGRVHHIANYSTEKAAVISARSASNAMTFMNRTYNIAGVRTHTVKDDQYIILTSDFDASVDVEVLAAAFNMDKAEFFGHRILVDSFAELDDERLADLLGADATVPSNGTKNYVALTDAQKTMLEGVKCVIVDREWFMIYDNFIEMASLRNPEGIYWNYWLHTWKTFAINPYAQAGYIGGAMPGVTLDNGTLTIANGSTALLTATTTPVGETVTWASSDTSVATVSNGTVTNVGEGTCIITASITVGGVTYSATCNVTCQGATEI